MLGLLFDAQTVTILVELGHTVALGVVHIVAEHGSTVILLGISHSFLQHTRETATIEDVVAEDETGAIVADELLTDDEGLCETVW